MNKSRAALHTAQILTGIVAAAAAYALKNRPRKKAAPARSSSSPAVPAALVSPSPNVTPVPEPA